MPFKKNESGNPLGRPKSGNSFRDLLEKKLSDMQSLDGISRKEAICEVLIGLAMSGDLDAIKQITDRIDGKPTQQILQTNVNLDEPKVFDKNLLAELKNSILDKFSFPIEQPTEDDNSISESTEELPDQTT
jgi:hypothetical protein